MAAQLSTIDEFQRRRNRTWRAIRWWLLTAIGSVLLMAAISIHWGGTSEALYLRVGSSLIILAMVCGAAVAFQIRRLYRCPRCGSIPIKTVYGWRDQFGNEARDVQWNPSSCPTCQAPLR
jgi:hypothetical protein